jgi:hypothetical protein
MKLAEPDARQPGTAVDVIWGRNLGSNPSSVPHCAGRRIVANRSQEAANKQERGHQ